MPPKPDPLLERYKAEMGREPPEPRSGDPLAWQWKYKGGKDERASLEARMRQPREENK